MYSEFFKVSRPREQNYELNTSDMKSNTSGLIYKTVIYFPSQSIMASTIYLLCLYLRSELLENIISSSLDYEEDYNNRLHEMLINIKVLKVILKITFN